MHQRVEGNFSEGAVAWLRSSRSGNGSGPFWAEEWVEDEQMIEYDLGPILDLLSPQTAGSAGQDTDAGGSIPEPPFPPSMIAEPSAAPASHPSAPTNQDAEAVDIAMIGTIAGVAIPILVQLAPVLIQTIPVLLEALPQLLQVAQTIVPTDKSQPKPSAVGRKPGPVSTLAGAPRPAQESMEDWRVSTEGVVDEFKQMLTELLTGVLKKGLSEAEPMLKRAVTNGIRTLVCSGGNAKPEGTESSGEEWSVSGDPVPDAFFLGEEGEEHTGSSTFPPAH